MSDDLIRIIPWVSLASIALLFVGLGLTVLSFLFYVFVRQHDEARAKPPVCPKIAAWLREPPVYVHRASCPIDLWRIESAFAYWRGLGHKIGPLQETNSLASVRGAILVVGQRSASTSAVTQISGRSWPDGVDLAEVEKGDHYCRPDEIISVFADGQIDHAVIVIPKPSPGRNMDLVMIHLVGHALGFAHAGSMPPGEPVVRRRGHVMSALLSEAGWMSNGLEGSPGLLQSPRGQKRTSPGDQ